MIINHDLQSISTIIYEGIKEESLEEMKKDIISYYAHATPEKLKSLKKKILEWKDNFILYEEEMNNNAQIEAKISKIQKKKANERKPEEWALLEKIPNIVKLYYDIYQSILKFRTDILGEKGTINYTLVFSTTDRGKEGFVNIHTITLTPVQFNELIFNKGNIELTLFDNNLRIKSSIITQIKNSEKMNKTIKEQINKNNFKKNSRSIIQGHILKLEQSGTHYGNKFIINAFPQQQKMRYEITDAHGGSKSSSIFSAIGKYLVDEKNAKQEKYNEVKNTEEIQSGIYYPNKGQITELYELAKKRLNRGANEFTYRSFIFASSLFQLYKQVKNSIAFYTGGDIGDEQIKSFLGSLPSLTSLSTIKNAVKKILKIMQVVEDNTSDITKIMEKLEEFLLQQITETATISEKEISYEIAQSFLSYFNGEKN